MAQQGKRRHERRTPAEKTTSARHRQSSSDARLAEALALYERGNARKARRILSAIIEKDPFNADCAYNLGVIAKSQRRFDDALQHWEKTLSINPGYVNAYFSLGGLFIDRHDYTKANEHFLKAVSLSPEYTNAWYNLGYIAAAESRFDDAVHYYEKALTLDPGYVNAWHNIGWIFLNRKQYDEAIRRFEKVISLDPGYADAFFNIGSALQNKGEYDQAIAYYEKTLAANPNYHQAYNNLGIIYQHLHKFDNAIACYEKAIAIHPDSADVYLNLGNAYREKGDVQKTIESYKKSLAIEPSLVGLNNLSGYQKMQSNYEEVYDLTLKIMEYKDLKKHDWANIHDTFIQLCEWEMASGVLERFRTAEMEPEGRDVLAGSFMEFCAITDLSVDEISEQHKLWGRLTEEHVTPFTHQERKTHDPAGKIRLGYSSPDLREHSVGYLIKDIIGKHNKEDFELFCYANFDQKDADKFTAEIAAHCDRFEYVKHLSDRELASLIYDDGIDILIDLAGHTAGHRLRALAYKPAPIQITYLGYPNTTGLSRMDYRLTDRFAESDPQKDYRYSEKLLRLTNCFLAFNGFGNVVPPHYEWYAGKEVVFGCFNNIQKLTPTAVRLWSEILSGVENSTLYLKAKQLNTPYVWKNVVREFAKHNIPEERLRRLGYTATREEHLRYYNEIDVAFDTFPYNGTVTTLEALWMNVPIVTLVGESHAQRVGYTILKNLSLESLIASSEEEYVGKCIELARNPEMIRELKTKMRANLLASSICNPGIITREMELHYKNIWIDYLQSQEAGRESLNGRMDDAIQETGRLKLAMVKIKAGEFEQALEISSALLDSGNVSHLAWYLRGVSLFRLGRKAEAITALETSLQKNPSTPGAGELLEKIRQAED